MTVQEAILARRSVRKFTNEQISNEQIHALLEAAMAAPSACNKQPWEFYVVRSGDVQEKLRKASRFTNLPSTLMIVVAGNDRRGLTHTENDYFVQDCSAAVENMLLTATEMGLGACWCGLYPMKVPVKRAREALGIEDERIIPLALVQLGYPDETPAPRTQYNEKYVHWVE